MTKKIFKHVALALSPLALAACDAGSMAEAGRNRDLENRPMPQVQTAQGVGVMGGPSQAQINQIARDNPRQIIIYGSGQSPIPEMSGYSGAGGGYANSPNGYTYPGQAVDRNGYPVGNAPGLPGGARANTGGYVNYGASGQIPEAWLLNYRLSGCGVINNRIPSGQHEAYTVYECPLSMFDQFAQWSAANGGALPANGRSCSVRGRSTYNKMQVYCGDSSQNPEWRPNMGRDFPRNDPYYNPAAPSQPYFRR